MASDFIRESVNMVGLSLLFKTAVDLSCGSCVVRIVGKLLLGF